MPLPSGFNKHLKSSKLARSVYIGGMILSLRRIAVSLCLIASLSGTMAFGQPAAPVKEAPDLRIAPPTIQFAPWQEVARTDDGIEYLATFPTAHPSGYAVNDTVPLRVFLPATQRPARVVLILHYWGALDLRLERTLALELNRRGIAAAIMTLPYHLSRTPAGYRSGELAIQPDPDKLVETMTQCVMDGRRAIDYLTTRPELKTDRIGLAGTSLGAVVTAMLGAIDDRITDASFLLGGVDLAHILWTSSRVQPQRDALRRKGFTEDRLRTLLAPIEPLSFLLEHHPANTFVIGGQFDTVVPRSSTEDLIDALQTNNVLWLDTGHYGGVFVERRLMREIAKFYAAQFTGAEFVTPKEIYAPTVRLGFKVDTASGLDIGIGLDLLKFDKRGEAFSTLFLTPRGPQLYLGRTIGRGISLGAFGSQRGAGLGVFWSTVL